MIRATFQQLTIYLLHSKLGQKTGHFSLGKNFSLFFFVFGCIPKNKTDSNIFCYSFRPKNPELAVRKKKYCCNYFSVKKESCEK